MSYIVMVKRGETSLGFSRGSGCEAAATRLIPLSQAALDVVCLSS